MDCLFSALKAQIFVQIVFLSMLTHTVYENSVILLKGRCVCLYYLLCITQIFFHIKDINMQNLQLFVMMNECKTFRSLKREVIPACWLEL